MPVVVGDSYEYIAKIVRANDMGLVININNLAELSSRLGELTYKELENNVKWTRIDLLMDNHIHRLEAFYGQVRKQCG